MRETDVYVIRKIKGAESHPVESEQGKSVASLAQFNEAVLGRPVLDESGLEGGYKFVWAFATDLTAINTQLKSGLGLEMLSTRRPLEVLVFEPVTR